MFSEQKPKPTNLATVKLILVAVILISFGVTLGVTGYLAKNKPVINPEPVVSATPEPTIILTPESTPFTTLTPIPSPIINDKVIFGKLSAYGKQDANYSYMILAEAGKETIVDQGHANYDFGAAEYKIFGNPIFSPKGNYLLYSEAGHESYASHIYDIKNKKKILNFSPDLATGFSFTPDEKNLYACSAGGMGSDTMGKIYDVRGFKAIYDVLKSKVINGQSLENYTDVQCLYDLKTESIIFNVAHNIIRYSLRDNKDYRMDNEADYTWPLYLEY